MFWENRSFPWWAGPLIGGLVGLELGAKIAAEEAAKQPPGLSTVTCFVLGVAMGATGGLVISLIELLSRRSGPRDQVYDRAVSASPVLDYFFAYLAIALFWVPFVGVFLSAIALVAMRRQPGKLRTIISIAAVLSVIISVTVIAAIIQFHK